MGSSQRRVLAAIGWLASAWLVGCGVAAEPASAPVDPLLEPLQEATLRQPFTVETRRGEVRLAPRARFEVDAVVVGTERYLLDASAFLSPLDLALAWGELAPRRARRGIDFWQTNRFCLWQTRRTDLDLARVGRQLAHLHLIPATPALRRALLAVDREEAVRLAGLLVDADGAGGFRWRTSLSRDDDGDGSCELLWVEELQRGERVFR